jgi:hypothetical protein
VGDPAQRPRAPTVWPALIPVNDLSILRGPDPVLGIKRASAAEFGAFTAMKNTKQFQQFEREIGQ